MIAELGFSTAIGEVTLVVFTTLGPSSTLAYLLMLIPLAHCSRTPEERSRLRKQLWIPLVLCMIGLIAAATHLGNPANALYVLAHIGSSPLSNEVAAAVVFLALAAVFWLTGFALSENRVLDRVLMVLIALAGIVLIFAIALAYNVATIATWSLPIVPASIVASAFVGGPPLALCTLHLAGWHSHDLRFERALCVLCTAGVVIWLALCALFGIEIGGISNSIASATELVPLYWPCLAVAAILLAAACVTALAPIVRGRNVKPPHLVTGTALSMIAIFIMRFLFYMAHMTVGVSL